MDEGLWENSFIDPETCGISSLYVPIGSPSFFGKICFMTIILRSMGSRPIADGDGSTWLCGGIDTPRLYGMSFL